MSGGLLEYLLGYIFYNTPSISLGNSRVNLVGRGLKYRGFCTTSPIAGGAGLNPSYARDNIDKSSVTFELPSGEQLELSHSFIEWFRGFTNAEGCFLIAKGKGNVFSFRFATVLHLDDQGTLEYICNTLGFGKTAVYSKDARFIVSTQREIAGIIANFSKYCLNTTKHLDFLAFSRAYVIYMNNNKPEARKESKVVIEKFISEMNSKRTDMFFS